MAALKSYETHLNLLQFRHSFSSICFRKLHFSPYTNLLLLNMPMPKTVGLTQTIHCKNSNRSFRCFCQLNPETEQRQKTTVEEEIERPPFDINLAVVLAGFAFEAYLNPPKDVGKREVDAAGCHTVFLSQLFLREVYDGQLFIKLKRGYGFPAMDPWGTSDPYVVIQLDGQVAKSKVKWATKEPTWNEDLTINIKKHPAKNLQIAAWDANLVAPHKRMGNAGISLEPLCDGNLHEVLVELEGMGGGGRIQLEVQYKSFEQIDKEKQWWRLPFVSEFIMSNDLKSSLKMVLGSENVKARQFVESAFGQLRSFNYAYIQKNAYSKGDVHNVEGSGKSLNSAADFSKQFLPQERSPEGTIDDSSGRMENGLAEFHIDSNVEGNKSNSSLERTVDESVQSDEHFWKSLVNIINQSVGQKLDFCLNDKIVWDGFELLKKLGSQSSKIAETWYVESGLATPKSKDGDKALSSLPSTLNEIQSSVADIKMVLPDVKSASLELLSKTDAILGALMVLNAAISQQKKETGPMGENENGKDIAMVTDGVPGSSNNEVVDINMGGSVLDKQKAEEMKALFSTAESAMEAWAMLATSLGRPSFLKSEFEKICFLDNESTDTQVAIWLDSFQNRLVVAFRGTEQVKWKDLRTDLMLAPTGFTVGF